METENKKPYDLDKRLIGFAVLVLELTEALPTTRSGNHIAGQLVRCGTSPALNYGEVQSAESRKDFIHKIMVVLKKLRETLICLKIIKLKPLLDSAMLNSALKECNELISIFVSSLQTARKKFPRQKS